MKDDSQRLWVVESVVRRYEGGLLDQVPTVGSTATAAIVVYAKKVPAGKAPTVTIEYTNRQAVTERLLWLFGAGYDYDVEDVKCTCSIHQNHLQKARSLLVEKVLKSQRPSIDDLEEVLLQCGVALNKQVDKRASGGDIHLKLRHIGLERDSPKLFGKYEHLNPFFNAAKHEDRKANLDALLKLRTDGGWRIAVDFYETVRRIFKWYYRKYSVGPVRWEELSPVRYAEFGVSYRFRYEKRW